MCALCGAFGITEHWSDASEAVGAAERQHRMAVANRCLKPFGLVLTDWSGRYTLTSYMGGAAVVDNFGVLWPEAERLAGRPCDPLDEDLIKALEGGPRP